MSGPFRHLLDGFGHSDALKVRLQPELTQEKHSPGEPQDSEPLYHGNKSKDAVSESKCRATRQIHFTPSTIHM